MPTHTTDFDWFDLGIELGEWFGLSVAFETMEQPDGKSDEETAQSADDDQRPRNTRSRPDREREHGEGLKSQPYGPTVGMSDLHP